MWFAFKARNFEFSEYKKLAKWFKKESIPLKPFVSKFKDFEIFFWFIFHQVDLMNM
jgi:hypothetical protein